MVVDVLSGEKGGPAGAAKGCGDKHILEPDPFCGNPIHVGGLENGIARTTHPVPPLVIGHKEDKIRPFSSPRAILGP